MAQALTERQQEIKRLLDQSKTPREIAEILGISENAVYQHRRRIRENGKTKPARRGRPPGAKTKPAEHPTVAAIRGSSETVAQREKVSMTPLQAIRARKGEIESVVRGHQKEFDDAARAADKAREALEQARAKTSDELAKLEAAENALTGVQPQRQQRRRRIKPETAAPPEAEASTNGQPPEAEQETEFAQAADGFADE